jgi:hypothetical protein
MALRDKESLLFKLFHEPKIEISIKNFFLGVLFFSLKYAILSL